MPPRHYGCDKFIVGMTRSDSFVLYRALVLGRSRRYSTQVCAAHRAAKREAFDAHRDPALVL